MDLPGIPIFLCQPQVQLFEDKFPPEFRDNFNSLWEAALTVFIVVIGDGWSRIMGVAIVYTNYLAALYFITLLVFGNFISLNLFIGVCISPVLVPRC